ncbi:MAG: DUF6496 domain-containing protein [Chitinophagaceae bacterium]
MAKYSKGAQKKVEKSMHEMKEGTLRSGKSGKKERKFQKSPLQKRCGEKIHFKKNSEKILIIPANGLLYHNPDKWKVLLNYNLRIKMYRI